VAGPYINEPGYEVPENSILAVYYDKNTKGYFDEIIQPLMGNPKRDWFTSHFYYCLPLAIGNQYGFVIKSMRDFDIIWDGTEKDAVITFLNEDNCNKQYIGTGFSQGIITVQNHFHLKTPPGINLMTIQPPNMFIPGCSSMTGVIESDQIRRDFTFNFKVTVPNFTIKVRKGDPLGAFIPIPRYFVDNFKIKDSYDFFDEQIIKNEKDDLNELNRQRINEDKSKPHESGRKYFNGVHAFGEKYVDHQKRVTYE